MPTIILVALYHLWFENNVMYAPIITDPMIVLKVTRMNFLCIYIKLILVSKQSVHGPAHTV